MIEPTDLVKACVDVAKTWPLMASGYGVEERFREELQTVRDAVAAEELEK